MKTLKYLMLLLFVFAMYSSCKKKYPDNPTIYVNLHSLASRLFGSWQVNHFLVNNIDEIQFYNDSCGCTFRFGALKNQPNYQDNGWYWWLENCKYLDLATSLSANADKNELGGNFYNEHNTGQPDFYSHVIMPFRETNIDYNIRRLTKKELWLKTTIDGNDYIIKTTKK